MEARVSAAEAMFQARYAGAGGTWHPDEVPSGRGLGAEMSGIEQELYACEVYGASERRIAKIEARIERVESKLEGAWGGKKARLERRLERLRAKLEKLGGGDLSEKASSAKSSKTQAAKSSSASYPHRGSAAASSEEEDDEFGGIAEAVVREMFG